MDLPPILYIAYEFYPTGDRCFSDDSLFFLRIPGTMGIPEISITRFLLRSA